MQVFLLLLAGCSGAPPAEAPAREPERQSSPPPVETGRREAGRRTAPADWVVAGWADLQPELLDVYLARVESRTTVGGTNALCIRPSKSARGRRPLPAEICTPVEGIVGRPRAWESVEPEMWVATQMSGSTETIAALVRNDCGGAPCGEPPGEALAGVYKCGQLDRVWAEIPPEHVACFEDRACSLLESTCFATAVNERFAERYRDVVSRHGGTCLAPQAGACASGEARAVCREGKCAAERTP